MATALIVAVLAGAMILMAIGVRDGHRRDIDDSVVVFTTESSLTADAIERCVAKRSAHGLWLEHKNRWPGALSNMARHQRLYIRDLGDLREVVMVQRSDHRLRPGERAQLQRCTGQSATPSS